MKQFLKELEIKTHGKSLNDFTLQVERIVEKSLIKTGIINLSILHTSASLIIQENADPDVARDILLFFEKLVPENNLYFHSSEGYDDMPAHLRSILTQSNITLSIKNKKLVIGKWQGIFLFEHRNFPKNRLIYIHIIGD